MLIKNYFKGWYFKCSTESSTIAFIPAIHRSQSQETASLQIITDNSAYNIPLDTLKYCEKPLLIKGNGCLFSEKGIRLSIHSEQINIHGAIKLSGYTPIKYDIMGPFKFVPFMQCRHSVYSMRHRIDGRIVFNGQQYLFKNGIGYIEGDCGYSFPSRYIWTQCCFGKSSLMLSIADIPISGYHFNGIIGIILLNGKEYRIATYLGASLREIKNNSVTVHQGDFRLTAKLIEKNSHPLFAPNNGKMSRTIHESAACKAYYRFSYRDKNLLEFTSDSASFEFEYKHRN